MTTTNEGTGDDLTTDEPARYDLIIDAPAPPPGTRHPLGVDIVETWRRTIDEAIRTAYMRSLRYPIVDVTVYTPRYSRPGTKCRVASALAALVALRLCRAGIPAVRADVTVTIRRDATVTGHGEVMIAIIERAHP